MAKEVIKSLYNLPEKAAQLKPGQKQYIQKHQNQYQNHGPNRGQNQNQSYRQAKLQQFRGRCLHCGSNKHTSNCPKTNLHCNRCNKPGHTGFVCLSNPHPRSQHQSRQQSNKTSPACSPTRGQSPERQRRASALTVVKNSTSVNDMLPKLQLCFSQNKSSFHYMATCDTGATITVIASDIIDRYQLQILRTSERLLMADGNPMPVTGTILMMVTLPGKQDKPINVKALVSPALHEEVLLSLKDQISLGLLPDNYPNHVKVCSSSILKTPCNNAEGAGNADLE